MKKTYIHNFLFGNLAPKMLEDEKEKKYEIYNNLVIFKFFFIFIYIRLEIKIYY